MSRREQLREDAERAGLYVNTYSPGDGVTRYRFTRSAEDHYFGPGNGIFTALGIGEARTFLAGYFFGQARETDAMRAAAAKARAPYAQKIQELEKELAELRRDGK